MAYSLTAVEREVVINFNAAEAEADIYTADPVWMRKLDKLVAQNPEQFRMIEMKKCEGKIVSKRYIFPKRFITIRTRDIKRELTEEQREVLRMRFKAENPIAEQEIRH